MNRRENSFPKAPEDQIPGEFVPPDSLLASIDAARALTEAVLRLHGLLGEDLGLYLDEFIPPPQSHIKKKSQPKP